MPIVRVEQLALNRHHSPLRERLWREWCFARMAARRFAVRLAVILAVLITGGLLFKYLEPEKNHSLARAAYYTWCLVLSDFPEEFPSSLILKALFFAVPILGLTVIIEAMVDLALMIRDRRRCERGWCTVMAQSMSGHIVLVGLGRLGYRTFLLLRRLGEHVVVIERDPAGEFLEEIRREGIPLLIGDARRESLLEDANIQQAKSIIAATNDDLANLEIALDARRLQPGIRVVLRMFDQNMADKVRAGFDIHIAISQSALSAPAFATAALDRTMVNSYVVGDQLVVMKRWEVQDNAALCGQTVAGVMAQHHLCVIERRTAGGTEIFPGPDTRLQSGDVVLVQGTFEQVSRVSAGGG